MFAHALLLLAFYANAADVVTRELDISADDAWVDTGVDVKAGDSISFEASGQITYQSNTATPDGMNRLWMDTMAALPVYGAGRGALVGRFSDSPAARAFLVGSKLTRTAPISSRLFLSINQLASAAGSGSYHVVIHVTPAASSQTPLTMGRFTQQMLDSIPARVQDEAGDLGDRVNFILVGSETNVKADLEAAGWVIVDRNRKSAVLHGLLQSLSKEPYVTLPMSELQLFGRVQDYGFAQGDAVKVVSSRHHFRIWKCPFALGGETVWAGAGTHDIGFDRDNRSNGVTHKIDPATDVERDYIGESLRLTGFTVKEEYLTPSHPVLGAKTATGAGFTSDGRTLIIYLQP